MRRSILYGLSGAPLLVGVAGYGRFRLGDWLYAALPGCCALLFILARTLRLRITLDHDRIIVHRVFSTVTLFLTDVEYFALELPFVTYTGGSSGERLVAQLADGDRMTLSYDAFVPLRHHCEGYSAICMSLEQRRQQRACKR